MPFGCVVDYDQPTNGICHRVMSRGHKCLSAVSLITTEALTEEGELNLYVASQMPFGCVVDYDPSMSNLLKRHNIPASQMPFGCVVDYDSGQAGCRGLEIGPRVTNAFRLCR